ncbi:CcdB family protein [Rudaea sp.]|uniref:CcdB family protein n=1 Tax=Rudaea sp. TaxID=2136325 RepID=UPI002ED1CA67
MERFDVFRNESPNTSRRFPFFLVVQSDLLDGLSSSVIVPLGKSSIVGGKLAHMLTPQIEIGVSRYVMCTPELCAVPIAALRKFEANVAAQRDVIVRALNFLFDGI